MYATTCLLSFAVTFLFFLFFYNITDKNKLNKVELSEGSVNSPPKNAEIIRKEDKILGEEGKTGEKKTLTQPRTNISLYPGLLMLVALLVPPSRRAQACFWRSAALIASSYKRNWSSVFFGCALPVANLSKRILLTLAFSG